MTVFGPLYAYLGYNFPNKRVSCLKCYKMSANKGKKVGRLSFVYNLVYSTWCPYFYWMEFRTIFDTTNSRSLLFAVRSTSSWMLESIEAGEMDSCRSEIGAILEFSSGNLPPELPPFPLLLPRRRCGATGGEDEGVPGDPENHSLVKSPLFLSQWDLFCYLNWIWHTFLNWKYFWGISHRNGKWWILNYILRIFFYFLKTQMSI